MLGYETMYRTGDYGRIVNGQLYYEGRADSQIKVRGHRIDLTEINAIVHQLEQVTKGVVLCYKPGQPEQVCIHPPPPPHCTTLHSSIYHLIYNSRQEIIAFVVSNNPSSIHQSLKQKLVSYAMPRVPYGCSINYRLQDEFHYNNCRLSSLVRFLCWSTAKSTGNSCSGTTPKITKVFRDSICLSAVPIDYHLAMPRKGKPSICRWNENELNRLDERERNIASALLKTVLSVLGGSLHKPLALTDNYFYVGGNSLNAVTVVTKLKDQGFYLGNTVYDWIV